MNGYGHIIRVSVLGLILLEVVFCQHYTDKWAVHVLGGERKARSVAEKYGFIYRGQIMPDYYHFQHRKVAKRSIYPSNYHHRHLASDPNVKWIEQQVAKRRVKRDVHFNDPKWSTMWYLNRGSGLDMNVRKAWAHGYTGKGVTVTILDDGIEKDHPDLKENYDEQASYDVNGHDPDPQPRYDYSNENRHGTRCAGEVAAQADNFVCSVGVAYGANIGGVRMLDGDVTDSVEAQSLSLNPQHIHIYSASWGPDDDGRTVDGPATLARKAFYDGITKGRGGLGSIFVWASGNGGRDGDNCNCDGYTNSIYTLSISSATENGGVPWYSEACSSTLATTYSSGSGGEKQILSTPKRNMQNGHQQETRRKTYQFQVITPGRAAPVSPPLSDHPSAPSTPSQESTIIRLEQEVAKLREIVERMDGELQTLRAIVSSRFPADLATFEPSPISTVNSTPDPELTSDPTPASFPTADPTPNPTPAPIGSTVLRNRDFWLLRPIDLPQTPTDQSVAQALHRKSRYDPVEEAKIRGSSTATSFARDLFNTLFTLQEAHNRNVSGVVKSKPAAQKLPLDPTKMKLLLSTVLSAFPDASKKTLSVAVNSANRSLWTRRLKNVDLPPFP